MPVGDSPFLSVEPQQQRKAILIFRDRLLPLSETFIRAQARALRRFEPYYVGSSRVTNGLDLPENRSITLREGGLRAPLAEMLFKLMGRAPRLLDRLRYLDPALIHAHFGIDGVVALPLARGLGVPLVVTFHGYDATTRDEAVEKRNHSHKLYVRRRSQLQREATLFIAVSEFIRTVLVGQGFPADRTLVHYIGIDTAFFQPDARTPRKPVVLFVGRLVEKKGCEHLIRAMREVHRTAPEALAIIIGDGPLRADLERLASVYGAPCTFLGAQPPEVIRDWMNRATVFCAPSVTAQSGDAEGFGLVFAEAQSMGLPVVSFRSGGIPEAVADGETGLLVAERDEHALVAALDRLLADRELWTRFSVAGRVRVRERFDLRTQTRRLEQIYDSAIAGARPS